MPRSTRTSSTASDGAASSSAAGGGEETTDGANRKKLTSQEKDKVREQKKSFSKSMYAMAVAYLKKHLERLKTEGRDDCWLLAIMAGFEVTDPDLVAKLDDNHCTSAKRSAPTRASPSSSGLPTRSPTAASGFSARCSALLWTSTTRAR